MIQSIHKNAASRLLPWLQSMPKDQDIQQRIQLLALLRLCTLNNEVQASEFHQVAQTVLNYGPPLDYTKGDLLVTLLACDLAEEVGSPLQVKSAKQYTSFLKELWEEGVYPSNTDLLNSIFSKGKAKQPQKITVRLERFTKNRDAEILKILEKVERSSSFGSVPIEADAYGILNIETMALRAIRNYDIPLAMRCIRSRLYLSTADSLLLRTSLAFIESQQCFDGSFGDFDADVLKVSTVEERNAILMKIKSVVSFQIMWTLLEFKKVNLLSSLHFIKQDVFENNEMKMD